MKLGGSAPYEDSVLPCMHFFITDNYANKVVINIKYKMSQLRVTRGLERYRDLHPDHSATPTPKEESIFHFN